MSLVHLAALWLSAPAMATTYDAELAIPSEHPSWMDEDYAPTYRRYLYKLDSTQDPGDMVVNSTDSRIKCHVEDSWIVIEFSADRDAWPAALAYPLSATCTYGGDTLDISVVALEPEVDPAFAEMEIQTTSSSQWINITRITDALVVRSFKLPTNCSGDFVAGNYNSTLADVDCRVSYRGTQPMVQVRVAEEANTGSGTCTLPLDDGKDYVLGINLDEHAP